MIPEKQWAEMVESAMKRKHKRQRARFAAMAMQGILLSRPYCTDYEDVAIDATKFADALIKELNK